MRKTLTKAEKKKSYQASEIIPVETVEVATANGKVISFANLREYGRTYSSKPVLFLQLKEIAETLQLILLVEIGAQKLLEPLGLRRGVRCASAAMRPCRLCIRIGTWMPGRLSITLLSNGSFRTKLSNPGEGLLVSWIGLIGMNYSD